MIKSSGRLTFLQEELRGSKVSVIIRAAQSGHRVIDVTMPSSANVKVED